jgi:hypothetical protein
MKPIANGGRILKLVERSKRASGGQEAWEQIISYFEGRVLCHSCIQRR